MKSTVTGLIGSLVLGALAMGCSAETGTPQGGEGSSVGETRSPLVLADMTAARARLASAVITDTDGIDKLLVFGGESAVGTEVNDVYLFDPAANSWSTKDKTYAPLAGGAQQNLPVLTNAQMIAIPGTDKALLTGGSDNGTASAKTYLYDLSDNDWDEVGALSVSREKFKLILCGTGTVDSTRILAIGGQNGATFRNTIEVFTPSGSSGSTPTGTWAQFGGSDTLSAARSNVAVAALDANYTKIIVAGGTITGDTSDKIDLVSATTSCAMQNIDATTAVLSTKREKAVAFPTGVTNEFYVTGGSSSGADSLDSSEKVTVNWTTPNSTAVAAGTAMTTKRQNPQIAHYASGYKRWGITGGLNTTPNPDEALNNMQAWNGAAATPAWAVEATFDTARYDGALEYLPSEGRMFFVGGQNVAGTILSKTEGL